MDNFDLRKYLVENKVTTQSRLNEELGTPSEGMHNTLLSYIRQDARDTYPKDYNKYFLFLRAWAKPTSGSNKPQIWVKFLKDLVKNKAVSMNDLIAFSEKGYNDGRKGVEGLAGYLYKQGTPETLRKIDNLTGVPKKQSTDIQKEAEDYTVYEPSTFRKPSGYREEVEQIKNLIKQIYPEYVNADIGHIMDADMELGSIAYRVYGINISVDDIYKLINSEDPSELPQNLIQAQKAIEDLTGEPMIALGQAMKELNIKA